MPGIDREYRTGREVLLSRLVIALQADGRVVAAWLAGSLGRGEGDDLSDIDLWIVVEDDAIAGIAAAPERFVQAVTPTVMEIAAPANAPEGGAYLLTWVAGERGPHQVDWYWRAATAAVRPDRTTLLFQRAPIPVAAKADKLPAATLERELASWLRDALLMMAISGKHVRRGNPWVTARHLGHVAQCVGTVEWLLDHGYVPAFDDPIGSRLPKSIPLDETSQLAWIGEALSHLAGRLAVERPALAAEFGAAVDQVRRWIGVNLNS